MQLNGLNKDALEQLLQNDVKSHRDLVYRINNTDKYKFLLNYIKATPYSRSFFENANTDYMYAKLKKELQDVVYTLGDEHFSLEEKVLNFLEYIRLNGMYESVGEKAAALSQDAINIALLGKGVCNSQSRFLELLLIASNEEANILRIRGLEESQDVSSEHQVTVVKFDKDKFYFLDPTVYNGKLSSIHYKLSDENFYNGKPNELYDFYASEEKINESRKTVYKYLIERYNIKGISEQLHMEDLTDLEKQATIITYLESILVPTTEKVNFRSILLDGKEIEVSKALELFFYANDIEFAPIFGKPKYNCMFLVKIDDKEAVINPLTLFSKEENKDTISKKWIAIRQPNEEFKTIDQLNENYDGQKIIERCRENIKLFHKNRGIEI